MKTTFTKYIVAAGAASFLLFFAGCHGHHKREGYMLKRLDHVAKKLDLNESQQKQYEAIRENVKKKMDTGREERKKDMAYLKAEFSKQEVDIDALATEMKGRMKKRPDMMSDGIDTFSQFYKILNNEQKTKLRKMIVDKISDFE